jgi:hypothetical protein
MAVGALAGVPSAGDYPGACEFGVGFALVSAAISRNLAVQACLSLALLASIVEAGPSNSSDGPREDSLSPALERLPTGGLNKCFDLR